MRQLSGVDASFLHMEDSRMTGHVGGLIILDPSTAERPVDLETMKEYVAARIPALPPLRWRLAEVPLGIDLPYWYDDHDVDLDFHVRSLALPAPGNQQQLIEQVSRIHARPLDRAHPLWELYVIEGLEGGKVAIYTKLHHAAIDGKAGRMILSTLLSPDPSCPAPQPPAEMPASETRPSEMEMLTRGWMGLLGHPGKSVELMLKGAAEWQKSMQHFGYAALGEARTKMLDNPPVPAPRLSFNKSMTARRNWAYGTVPLSDVKKIKESLGCTINDVVMAICAGALRQWLLDHDELPEAPLRAMVPVSIRTAEQADTAGNQVSAMIAELPTHLTDPLARVEAVHASMSRAKEDFAALPAALLQEFAQFAAPAAAELVARTAASLRLADTVALPFNLVISNVPGPREPLYYAGALMEANYPVSMISDGMGLNITVQSYRDNMDFGLISCPELIPDLERIIDYIVAEAAALAAV
ncbi:WS/DGAT/MGAT family O-acyltransferase [Nocardioides albidus]|nr:wax ester/triacylglycerol synthase family O-acyltransferase [Nocardioides albidus]